jgi:hypothetical protein
MLHQGPPLSNPDSPTGAPMATPDWDTWAKRIATWTVGVTGN